MLAWLKVTNCPPASSFYVRKLMGTVHSQGIWKQSKLQAHTRESKAVWTTEAFTPKVEKHQESKRSTRKAREESSFEDGLPPGQDAVFESVSLTLSDPGEGWLEGRKEDKRSLP